MRDEPASEHFWRHSGSLSALRCSTVATSWPASSKPPRDSPAQTTQHLGTRYGTSGIPGGGMVGLGCGVPPRSWWWCRICRQQENRILLPFHKSASQSVVRSLGHSQPPLPAREGWRDHRSHMLLAGLRVSGSAGSGCIAQSGCIGCSTTPIPSRHVTPCNIIYICVSCSVPVWLVHSLWY